MKKTFIAVIAAIISVLFAGNNAYARTVLKYGDRGPEVKKYQQGLIATICPQVMTQETS